MTEGRALMVSPQKQLRWCRILAAVVGVFLSGPPIAHAQQESTTSSAGAEYLIGPGDRLEIFVWGQDELKATIPVRPDGKISTPLVEDMVAVGKTPTQLARDMEHVLSEYVRSPQVTVIVEQFVGTFAEQIRVLGQVERPGPVPYRDRMTLLDVMLEVGGLTEFAAGNRGKLVRMTDGVAQESRVRLDRLLNHGDLRENWPVQPGDVVIVPEAIF